MTSTYTLGKHTLSSRLIIGTGKYTSFAENLACAEASGVEMVTVALRRVKLDAPKGEGLLDFISPDRFAILPNTAGCYTVEEAVSTAHMAREALETDLIKLGFESLPLHVRWSTCLFSSKLKNGGLQWRSTATSLLGRLLVPGV